MLRNIYVAGTTTPTIEDLLHLLLAGLKGVTRVSIFVDGLDEVLERDRKIVFSNLKCILADSEAPAKVFVSGREDTTYLLQTPGTLSLKARVASGTNSDDISSYIRDSISHLVERGDLSVGDPSLEIEIFDALAAGAKGM